MKPVTIRPATTHDFETLKQFSYQLLVHEKKTLNPNLSLGWTDSEESVATLKKCADGTSEHCGFIAEAEGRPIGALTAMIEVQALLVRNRTARIGLVFVEEPFRNTGVGSRFFETFKAWARDQKADQLRVTSWAKNQSALRFYERHGFVDAAITLEQPMRSEA
jgi:GNAT superfamily N-acetyltransferase